MKNALSELFLLVYQETGRPDNVSVYCISYLNDDRLQISTLKSSNMGNLADMAYEYDIGSIPYSYPIGVGDAIKRHSFANYLRTGDYEEIDKLNKHLRSEI